MSLNDDKTRHAQSTYRVLVPHWEAAIDGKVFTTVTAPDRETARLRAQRQLCLGEAHQTLAAQKRVTVRYLCNK